MLAPVVSGHPPARGGSRSSSTHPSETSGPVHEWSGHDGTMTLLAGQKLLQRGSRATRTTRTVRVPVAVATVNVPVAVAAQLSTFVD